MATLTNVKRTKGLLQKFQQVLPKPSLITIYKAFIRPYLDYGDVIFDQTFSNFFHKRLESIKYKAALVITGATRGTSKGKLYQELGFESLQSRRWFQKLSPSYKITKSGLPSNLYYLTPKPLKLHIQLITLKIYLPLKLITAFIRTLFLAIILKWNKLDSNNRCSPSYKLFKKKITRIYITWP